MSGDMEVGSKEDSDVWVGPDLNCSRTPLDKKLYRQIILKKNGLRVVLISDTLAMGQQRPLYGEEDSEEDEEAEDGAVDDIGDSDDEEESEEKGNGLRQAAAALLVGAGSYHDPPHAQGLAHFLEHMLFMGTTKYPTENAYDFFLSKNGGSNNAYTELEHTLYHFDVPQEKLLEALDIMSQFFVEPLLLENAVDRELMSVESEFQLSRNSDECRLQQLLCHTSGHDGHHPFGQFSAGNLKSLKEIPESDGVDIMKELWKFYNQYYYAQNMRLVVIGAYSLDELQSHVLRTFSNVPAHRRDESSFLNVERRNAGTWEESIVHNPIRDFGMPFSLGTLGCIHRSVPVRDRHTLSITWQILSQGGDSWKTKPCEYISHLLGHEADGSLLSSLKDRLWVNSCYAGVGSDGHENASSHALFSLTFTLSEEGVLHWNEIVSEVYTYIGMLRHYSCSKEGFPKWIFEELQAIQEVSHKFGDEMNPCDLVENLAECCVPWRELPAKRLLDGNALLFEYGGESIKNLLNTYLTPTNARVDLMSSTFGRASDFKEHDSGLEEDTQSLPGLYVDSKNANTSGALGLPHVEPWYGTQYWCHTLPIHLIEKWSKLAEPQLPPISSQLRLPPVNPFVPTQFDLKSLPDDDSNHPMLHCALKICTTVGKKKTWFPATVTQYNKTKNQILLSYEDEDEQWHLVDLQFSDPSFDPILPGCEGTLDKKVLKFKIVAVPKDGEGAVMMYGDDSDSHVEDGIRFPPIPPALPESRMPQLILDSQKLRLWHLKDRTFKRPIAELRMKLVCPAANKTPLHRACADLFAILCQDAMTETCYLASVCELGSSLSVTDAGFSIRVHGFDHKILNLTNEILKVFFSFRCQSEILPKNIKAGRFDACLELLLRKYGNAGMKASTLCTDVRLWCILPTTRSPNAKAIALNNLTVSGFMSIISSILDSSAAEALFHGNVDRSDADEAKHVLMRFLEDSADILKKKHSLQQVVAVPLTKGHHTLATPSIDPQEPNTAVEVYFQVGKDDIKKRVLMDLLSHILEEQIFDQLRTKEQFGYEVSCGSRWTHGVIGISFKIVSSCKSAQEVTDRLETFLVEFRDNLAKMKNDEFLENLVGLAKNKLEMYNSLEEECNSHWSEITEGRCDFDVHRSEALSLRSVTQNEVLKAYDEWLLPNCEKGKPRKRRKLAILVIGTTNGGHVPCEIPHMEHHQVRDYIDSKVEEFHKHAGVTTWGKIY